MKAAFLIAAPHSGSGKTTVARGLMGVFRRQGLVVQPFKCGPDYIDTKFHESVCGRPSYNLDTFMASEDHVRELFARHTADCDVAVVEGMMGLFDGYDRDRGSSAEVARVLGLPVVLVVDARSAAYSMAPLLQGFRSFRSDVSIAGVIFNKVGSPRHRQMLSEVCQDIGLPCFGFLPKQQALEQGSRYLGLDFSSQTPLGEDTMNTLALDDLLSLTPANQHSFSLSEKPNKSVTALVARNADAFSFLYQESIDRLGPVRFFDPESEVPSFEGVDMLYLPGGYPEKHLQALVRNDACRTAIRRYAEQGGRIVAECGGMMYLCREIVDDSGSWPMCGVLPYSITARQQDRKLSLGYRRFELDGQTFRGHEFHYTQFLGDVPPSVAQVYNAKGEPVPTPVFRYGNVLASYTHMYLPDNLLR